MLKVRDIMTSDVVTFTIDQPLAEALKQLLDERMGGAPVLDGGRVVGVLSRTDIVAAAGDRAALTVGDVMNPLVHYVRVDEPAMSAVRMMLDERIHRVVVTCKRGDLAGIVTTIDILRAVARGQILLADAGGLDGGAMHAEAPAALLPGPG